MTTRREFLVLLGGAAAAGAAQAQLPPNIVALRREALAAAMKSVTGGAEVRAGRVTLDVPPLIDNGNSVPISVSVDSPMTPAEHVRSIHIFTEKNPQPNILAAHLGPRSGRAAITTRARIADTGRVIAVAQLSDGSFWSDSVEVIVTLSACLEDGVI
ncbi:MAG: SoxY-related AACIE arm protein [Betaproteobacteria bacterium]